MLSPTALSAFAATTTTPTPRSPAIRLVRDLPTPARLDPLQKNALPTTPPTKPPPRGTLLNLSV